MNPDASDPTVPRRGTRRELRQSPGLQPTIPGSRTGKAPLTGTHSDRPDPASRQPPDRNVARSSSGFRVGDELGRGGMGTVRSAEDVDLGRELAIKFLQRADAESVERFLEEAQITAQLEHPNIVPVHQLGRDADGRPWLAMKRIDGQSLADHLTAEKQRPARLLPEDLDRCLQVFGKVCDAVAFAHSRGVIHRDIKPANVMVGAFGEVLLVDWGLARPLDVSDDAGKRPVRTARRNDASGALLTVDGDVFGTPAYMPPEQAEGRTDEVDERADIFALGGLLYHMLTLEPPYSGRTPTLTVAMAARHQLIPPRRRAPGRAIPKELQAIVLKAMAALPADRYQTVHDLQADLSAWHAFRRTTAWRAGPIERLVKWTRRHPTASLGVALFVVAGLVVAVLLSQLAAAREAETAARNGERLAAIERDKEKGRADTLGKLARAV
ncbi:MAG: serine/threonine-protein kinase, partial [Planctomycetota bacterium]